MPRTARILNEKKVYHIMLRGNNKEKIFKDNEDKEEILQILKEKKQSGEYFLYAYCVLDNHIHLILKEGSDSLCRTMKRIGVNYAQYFNKKYKRVGHVFQDRYKSEIIDTDTYLLAAIRYVHQNPAKAGIEKMAEYKWSSFKDYVNQVGSMVETDEILGMFAPDKEKGLEAFISFNYQDGNEKFFDADEEKEIDEGNIGDYIDKYLKEKGIPFEGLKEGANKDIREELIRILVKKSNLSKRNIAIALGLNRETVRKVALSMEPSP